MSVKAIFDSIQSAQVKLGVDDFELYRKTVFVPSGSDESPVGLSVLDVWPARGEPQNSILLLHGFAANGSWWRPQLPALAQRNRVIVIDMRGNGRSAHPKSGYTTEQFATDAKTVLDYLDVAGPVIVAGHSTGGFVATDFALLFPEYVKRLILVATPLDFEVGSTIRTAKIFMSFPDFVYRLGQPIYELDPRGQASLYGLKHLFKDSLLSWNGRNKYPRVTQPTLVIEGHRDALFSEASYQAVTDLIPQTERVNISISKHQVTLERPQAVLRAILRFITPPAETNYKPMWRSSEDDFNQVGLLRERPWVVNYTGDIKPEIFIPKVPLARLLSYAARQFENRQALRCGKQRLTYRQFFEETNRFANWLHALGVQPGTCVMLLLPNWLHFPIAFYGCMRLGATVVLSHLHADVDVLGAQARESEAAVLVTAVSMQAKANAIVAGSGVKHLIYVGAEDYAPAYYHDRSFKTPSQRLEKYLDEVERVDGLAWLPHMLAVSSASLIVEPDVEDTAVILYTTSNTKSGIKLSQQNLLASTFQVGSWLHNLRPGKSRLLCAAPIHTAYGLTYGLNLSIYRGAQLILMPQREVDDIVAQVARYKPNVVIATPAFVRDIYTHPDKHYVWPKRRPLFISSGALLALDVREAFLRIVHANLLEAYGLSQTSQVAFMNPVKQIRAGSIGVPLPNTEICLVDPHNGLATAIDEVGELWLRGPQITHNESAIDAEGWCHTGDLMVMDAHGFFHYMGRLADVWQAHTGEQVYVRDVMEVIYDMPEVAETAVQVTPAGLVAYVRLLPGEKATAVTIETYCRNRLPASHIPTDIQFVDVFPFDWSGKLVREKLFAKRV